MDVQKPIKKQIVEDNKADKPYEKLNTTKDDICKQKNLAEESDSEDEALLSRIGNVPIEWYKNEEHIGYDIYGNPIKQYDQGDTIDAFLRRTDDPNAMRTIFDPLNNCNVVLTNEEQNIIHRLRHGKFPHRDFNPDEDYTLPLEIRVEKFGKLYDSKKSFMPSKGERKIVLRLINSIRNGWIRDPRLPQLQKPEPDIYDIWSIPKSKFTSNVGIPPSSVKLPGHEESFSPPDEYLWTKEEYKEKIQENDIDEIVVPRKYSSLQLIPSYKKIIQEQYKRCLQLYLGLRKIEKKKKNINIYKQLKNKTLETAKDQCKFPEKYHLEFKTHTDNVTNISISPSGEWLASGSKDGTVKLWEVNTGQCLRTWVFHEPIQRVSFNPDDDRPLLAIGLSTGILIQYHGYGTISQEKAMREQQYNDTNDRNEDSSNNKKLSALNRRIKNIKQNVVWDEKNDIEEEFEEYKMIENTIEIFKEQRIEEQIHRYIHIKFGARSLHWHHRGDYIATVSSIQSYQSVIIHKISSNTSKYLFTKFIGNIKIAQFHPSEPIIIICTLKTIFIYNIKLNKLIKKFQTPCNQITTLCIHPDGKNLLIGSQNNRIYWYEYTISKRPTFTLNNHSDYISCIKFHKKYPLFFTSSHDGTVHIFHYTIYDDLITKPKIIPLKIIRTHKNDSLSIYDCEFHPIHPWIFISGAKHMIRLYI